MTREELREKYWGKHKRTDYPKELIERAEQALEKAKEDTVSPTAEQIAELADLDPFMVSAILDMNVCDLCGYTKQLDYCNHSADPQDALGWCQECQDNRKD